MLQRQLGVPVYSFVPGGERYAYWLGDRTAGRRISRRSSTLLLAGLFACAMAFGQAVSQISGSERSDRRLVPGVQITATQTETDFKRSTVTDDAGNYVLTRQGLRP